MDYILELSTRVKKGELETQVQKMLADLKKRKITDIDVGFRTKDGMDKATNAMVKFRDEQGKLITQNLKLIQGINGAEDSFEMFEKTSQKVAQTINTLTKKEYNIRMKAMVESGELRKSLDSRIRELESSGATNIDLRLTESDKFGGLTRGIISYTDSLGDAKSETQNFTRNLENTDVIINRTTRDLSKTKEVNDSFVKSLQSTISRATQYALSMLTIHTALSKLRNGVQYIKELDEALIDAQIVTGFTDEQVDELAQSYNRLAKELKVTTGLVADSSLEWLRAGKTIEETAVLTESTMALAKLGNVGAEESTTTLTAALNSFRMEASQASSVVDKLVAVDNAASTSTLELSESLRRSASSAQQAHVSLDELIALTGVVSSVTRRSGETVGVSLRNLLTRYQKLSTGGADSIENLNNVEKALRGVSDESGKQIEILDRETGTFRSFTDVMKDVAFAWEDLTGAQQSQIAESLAGQRHRESLIALLKNQDMYTRLLTESQNSAGLSAERYAIYLEGLEAAQNKSTASWEAMWSATIDGDLVKTFYETSAGLADFITNLGGLDEILPLVIVGLGAYAATATSAAVATLGGLVPALSSLTVGFTALFGVMAANPIGIVITLLGSLLVVTKKITTETAKFHDEAKEGWESHVNTIRESVQSTDGLLKGYIDSLKILRIEYDKLSWVEKIVVSRQDLIDDSIAAISDGLAKTAGSWDEYYSALQKVAEETGYLIDENGQLYKDILYGDGTIVRKYNESFGTLSKTMWLAGEAASADRKFINQLSQDIESDAIPALAKYTETFGAFLRQTSELSGDSVGVNRVVEDFERLNDLFRTGSIDHKTYFEQFAKEINRLNMSQMFGENEESAQVFFSGLVENTAESMNQINDLFANGELSVTEYSDNLASIGGVFNEIGSLAQIFLGDNSVIDDAIRNITEGVDSLSDSQEANVLIQDTMRQVTEDTLKFSTEAYNEQMDLVSRAMAESGILFETTAGNALESADEIYGYLASTNGNFQLLAEQAASQTGSMMENVVQGAGFMLEELANMIDEFDASITFTPVYEVVKKSIAGFEFDWPTSMSLEVGADISVTKKSPQSPSIPGTAGQLAGTNKFAGEGESIADKLRNVAKAWKTLDTSEMGIDVYDLGFEGAEAEAEAFKDTVGSISHEFYNLEDSSSDAMSKIEKDMAAYNKLVTLTAKKLKDEAKRRKESLEDELDGYRQVINAKKEVLKTQKETDDYQRMIDEKSKTTSRLEKEIAELSLDDSEEAKARRLQLESELADNQEDIDNAQADRQYKLQQNALDRELELFELGIQSQIDMIDNYLSRPGEIVSEAMAQIQSKGSELYKELIEWNSIYGTGLESDVVSVWAEAQNALSDYTNGIYDLQAAYESIRFGLPDLPGVTDSKPTKTRKTGYMEVYHNGGVAGGNQYATKETEIVAKLLRGELTSTAADTERFINSVLPKLVGSIPIGENTGVGNVTIDKVLDITVEGNLDSSVIPDLDRISNTVLERLNEMFNKRGIFRSAKQFSS